MVYGTQWSAYSDAGRCARIITGSAHTQGGTGIGADAQILRGSYIFPKIQSWLDVFLIFDGIVMSRLHL